MKIFVLKVKINDMHNKMKINNIIRGSASTPEIEQFKI